MFLIAMNDSSIKCGQNIQNASNFFDDSILTVTSFPPSESFSAAKPMNTYVKCRVKVTLLFATSWFSNIIHVLLAIDFTLDGLENRQSLRSIQIAIVSFFFFFVLVHTFVYSQTNSFCKQNVIKLSFSMYCTFLQRSRLLSWWPVKTV